MAYTSIGASANIPTTTGPTTTTTTTTQLPGNTDAQLPPKPYMVFNVTMTCSGCSGAIERVLKRAIVPPNEFSVSLDEQTVRIWGPSLPEFDQVEAKIKKTGKQINSGEYVGEEEAK